VNFGSWALGSSAHIFAQALNEKYGLKMEIVTYKGEAPDVAGHGRRLAAGGGDGQSAGDERLACEGRYPWHRRAVQGARFTAARRADVAREQGFDDDSFTFWGWLALAAPAATPKEVVKKMSDLWVAAADSEPGRKMMQGFGLVEKPLTHEAVMVDYEKQKSTS
jgi:tripartite-type tricarboxylate transporter receptor subunit TctC